MSRRRDWLIQDSRSFPVDAASRALRGDVDGSAAAQELRLRLLAAELADMFERAGPLVRGASEVVPPGMAVSVGGDEWCTKIVLHLLANDERACTP